MLATRRTRHAGVSQLDRITLGPNVLNGQAAVQGTRLSVKRGRAALAENPGWEGIRVAYPELEPEDMRQVPEFAGASIDDRMLRIEAT